MMKERAFFEIPCFCQYVIVRIMNSLQNDNNMFLYYHVFGKNKPILQKKKILLKLHMTNIFEFHEAPHMSYEL
jgi:hypothetical protein